MDEIATGKIHKIFVGDNLSSYFEVGKNNRHINATVVEIVKDVNYLIEYGIAKHLVIVEDNDTQERWLWVELVGLPFQIQYSNPEGNQENII